VVEPHALNPKPSMMLALLGGVVAALLLSALIYLAPVFRLPFIDIPLLIGGIFTTVADTALWLGFWIYFLIGVFIFAPLLRFLWTDLPGDAVSFGGALLKGVLWGVTLGIISGLLLPLFGLLNRLPAGEVANPGFFALNQGFRAAVGLLLGHLLYGIALALVTNMGQAIDPLEVIGWPGYSHGESYQTLRAHRQGRGER
jgi:hypothetical protein